jgi:hypothetical protein
MGMMTNSDLMACEVAAKGIGWAAGQLNSKVGPAVGRILGGVCKEKYTKDRLYNDQLDYCHHVAETSGDDASKNPKLQAALLDWLELTAITGDTNIKSMHRRLYLQERGWGWGWGDWYPYKWKNIPRMREAD